MSITVNTPPPAENLCADDASVADPPVIRFLGGVSFAPTIDPTKGSPGPCSMALGLVGKLDAGLAALGPVLTILDAVAHLGQCVLLIKDALTNPFKVKDLLACIPGLVGKINALLALVPALPQGIVAVLQMVVDILRAAALVLRCVLEQLEAVRDELGQVAAYLEAAASVEDEEQRERLLTYARCGQQSAERTTATALAALAPIARIVCTARTLLALTGDAGRELARSLRFPDASSVESLDDAIAVVRATRDVLETAVETITAFGAPLGLGGPPSLSFRCPLDDESSASETSAAPLPTPVVTSLVPAFALAGASDTIVRVVGHGLLEGSQVFLGTVAAEVQGRAIDATGRGEIVVTVPSELLRLPGEVLVHVANARASSAGGAFSGLASSAGAAAPADGSAVVGEPASFLVT